MAREPAEKTSELSRQFFNASVDEYHRMVGRVGRPWSSTEREALFAHAKLEVMQKWIDEEKDLSGLNIGSYEFKFI